MVCVELTGSGLNDGLFVCLFAVEFGGDAAVGENEDAITEGEEFGEFAGGHEDGESLIGELSQEAVDFGFGCDIDAAGGVIKEEYFGASEEAAGDETFLLVAAAE